MIDWQSTKNEFGTDKISGYRPKVIYQCDRCEIIINIHILVQNLMIT